MKLFVQERGIIFPLGKFFPTHDSVKKGWQAICLGLREVMQALAAAGPTWQQKIRDRRRRYKVMKYRSSPFAYFVPSIKLGLNQQT